jgi:hypothetical protein
VAALCDACIHGKLAVAAAPHGGHAPYRRKDEANGGPVPYVVPATKTMSKFTPKFYCVKRRFFVTSKYRHMHIVLNVDKIK